jgi:hypothetical protein
VTAPLDVDLTEFRVATVVPTDLQVPFEMTTGSVLDALSLTSLTATAPVPVAKAWSLAVPFAPEEPTLAFQVAVTVAADAGPIAATAITAARAIATGSRRDRLTNLWFGPGNRDMV